MQAKRLMNQLLRVPEAGFSEDEMGFLVFLVGEEIQGISLIHWQKGI